MKTHLALVTTGDFYQAKAYLTELCRELNVNARLHLATVPPSIAKKLKLDPPISYFEFALDDIVDTALDEKPKILRFSRFPSVSRDVTFKVSEDTPYAAVETALNRALEKTKLIYKIEPVSIYEPEQNLKKTKNLSFHIILNSEEKTLNSNEISDIMSEVTNKTCQAVGGELI